MRIFLIAAVVASPALWSQEFRGTLTGRVLDPSDAPVAGASVTVKNEGTNVAYGAKTDSHGNYVAPMLPPGTYSVLVAAQGFKHAARTGLELTVAQTQTQDFKLEIGALTEEVTVRAEAPVLEQATADRGGLVDAQAVKEYPLTFRNPFMLGALVPGVDYNGELNFQRPSDNGAIARWNINGSNANNEFLLDGAPNNAQSGGNNIAYVPPVDSVQEFRIHTNSYDAQYGKTAGGIVNVALKSGTNLLHGAVYEFLRRNALDCNSFQNNARGARKDGHYLDQYGVQFDGPLYIPKLYDGRNRTFFLFNYEGTREGSPSTLTLSVPEPEMRNGDFSKLLDAAGQLVTIYDPATGRSAGSRWVRDPFPGNIPADRVNPIARKILDYYPAPNAHTPGVAYSRQNYFVAGGSNPTVIDFYNLVFKFDQNFGTRHRAFLRHASNDLTQARSINGIRDKAGADGAFPLKRVNDAYLVDWVTILSPTMILNTRLSFSRYVESSDVVAATKFDLTTLGFPASLASALPYNPGFGRYALDDYLPLGKSLRTHNATNTWSAAASLTSVNGAHTTKAGYDTRWIQYGVKNPGTVFELGGNRIFTRADFTRSDAISGDAVAGWLLGTPSSGTVNYNSTFVYLVRYMAPWVQHDWKVTSRLTLNAGLRFDFNFPPNERYNRINRGFDERAISPLDPLIDYRRYPELPKPLLGGLLFAGENGVPRTAADSYLNTWQPRAGLAYSVTRSTVIRGGWGRYYSNPSNNFHQSYGFNAQTTMSVSPDGNRTTYPNMINNPFPAINLPRGSADGLLTYAGRTLQFVNSRFRTPHVDLFSFGIQRAVGARGRFEISYSGSRGYDQESTKAFNEQDDGAFRDRCNLLLGGDPGYCDAAVSNPFKAMDAFAGTNWYTADTISRNQILRPYPQFSGLTVVMLNTGRSWYNSLQSLYSVRIRDRINLNVNYTFAKNEQRTGYLDPQNSIMQQGVTQFDRPHRFVVSMISQLPFGKGQRWLNGSQGMVGKLVSGWQSTLIFNVMSGVPWALPGNVMYLKDARIPFGWEQEKVQAVKPCVLRWNNDNTVTMMQFSRNYGCTEANWLIVPNYNPRYTPNYDSRVRSQRVRMADVSLNKMTQVTERLRVQFRAEAFNITNSFFVTSAMFNNAADTANFGSLYKSTASNQQSNYPRYLQLGIKLLW